MKKLFICALVLTALASCKKEDPNEGAMISIDMRCKSCAVEYRDQHGVTIRDTIDRSLVVSYRIKVGQAVNVAMWNFESGQIVLAIASSTGGTRYVQRTEENYQVGVLFYNSVKIK